MDVSAYQTTAEMLVDHPDIRAAAVAFRLRRLLVGEVAALAEIGVTQATLIARWHSLQAAEAPEQRQPGLGVYRNRAVSLQP